MTFPNENSNLNLECAFFNIPVHNVCALDLFASDFVKSHIGQTILNGRKRELLGVSIGVKEACMFKDWHICITTKKI